MRNHLRDSERNIALDALDREGTQSAAYGAVLTAIRNSSPDSLDRYLLFNVATWMLENWSVPHTKILHQQLLDIMDKMKRIQKQLHTQPRRKQPGSEKARRIRKRAS